MREGHQPPAHGEEQPAADEGGGEDDEREAPLEVHQRGEDVLQEAALLADVLVRQVARPVLGDEARLVHPVPEHRFAGHAGGEARQPELLRDDALPRQHGVDAAGGRRRGRRGRKGEQTAGSVRLYARTRHVQSAHGESPRCERGLLLSRLGRSPLLCPVDVVQQRPESRPAQTRLLLLLLLPSGTAQAPSENTKSQPLRACPSRFYASNYEFQTRFHTNSDIKRR